MTNHPKSSSKQAEEIQHRVVEPTDNQESVKGGEGIVTASVVIPKDNSLEAAPIYVASRASIPERGAMWRKFRDDGIPITSSWIDEDGEGQTSDFGELWERIANEIAASQALVLYAEAADFPLKGAFIEAGIALGMGKPVIVCLPDLGLLNRTYRPIGSWIAHPLVTRVDSIAAAVSLASKPDTKSSEASSNPELSTARSAPHQSESVSAVGPTTEVPAEPPDWIWVHSQTNNERIGAILAISYASSEGGIPYTRDCQGSEGQELFVRDLKAVVDAAIKWRMSVHASLPESRRLAKFIDEYIDVHGPDIEASTLATKPTTAEPKTLYAEFEDWWNRQDYGDREQAEAAYIQGRADQSKLFAAEPPAAEEMKN